MIARNENIAALAERLLRRPITDATACRGFATSLKNWPFHSGSDAGTGFFFGYPILLTKQSENGFYGGLFFYNDSLTFYSNIPANYALLTDLKRCVQANRHSAINSDSPFAVKIWISVKCLPNPAPYIVSEP